MSDELALVLETDITPSTVLEPFVIVQTLAERDAIPSASRQEGMFAYVVANTTLYNLVGGILNTDWAVFAGGGGGSSNALTLMAQTTTGLASGDLVYLSGAAAWSKARSNGSALEAAARGIFSGVAGSILLPSSFIPDARFTTVGGLPSVGARVFLASSADDAGTGAGKFTATAPTSGFLFPAGVVVDNADWSALKTCEIIFSPEIAILL